METRTRKRFRNVSCRRSNFGFCGGCRILWCHFLVAAAAATSHPPQYNPSTSVNTPISSPQVNPTTTRSLIHPPPLQEGFVPVPGLQEPSLSLLPVLSRTTNEVIRYRNASYRVATETLPIESLLKRFLSILLPKQEHSYVSETRWMSIVSETIHTHYIFETHITTTFP